MSSTLRGYNRHKSDYYITPKKDIKTDKKEAAKAYNLAARKFHGNFAVFNKI